MLSRSIYTPEGTFRFLLFVVAASLVAAVVYLLAFTSASLPF